jgi:hypothetical protein
MGTKATSARKRVPRKGKNPAHRVSLIHDPRIVDAYLSAIRVGNWSSVAASFAGISKTTVSNWLSRGEAARALEEQGLGVPAGEQPYLDFLGDHEKAEAVAETTIVANLSRQSQTSPQAATNMLRLRWPDRWREAPSQVEVSGPQGGPIALSPVLAEMTQEQLEAKAKELEAEMEAEGK